MNYLKIYTLLLCAVLIAACSDDEEQFNSGAATVNLQETAMTVKESASLCTACCCDGRTYRNYPCDVRIKRS